MNDANRPDKDASLSLSPFASLVSLWQLWFGFSAPVSRRAYILSGLFLTTVKYLGKTFLCYLFIGNSSLLRSISIRSFRDVWRFFGTGPCPPGFCGLLRGMLCRFCGLPSR